MDIRNILANAKVYEIHLRVFGAIAFRKRVIKEFIKPFSGMRILDIGCGPGTMLKYLPKEIEYVGYDLSPSYINDAKARFGSRGRFYCSDVNHPPKNLDKEKKFDIVMAIGVLHHLPDTGVNQLFTGAFSHLKQGGTFITAADPVFHKGQSKLSRWIISKDRGNFIRNDDEYYSLLTKKFNTVNKLVLTDALWIPYSTIVMMATKDIE